MDHKEKIKSIIGEIRDLNNLGEVLLSDLITLHSKEYQELYSVLTSFITLTCGNINKVNEKRRQLELLKSSSALFKEEDTVLKVEHINDKYGADIIITTKDEGEVKVELKSSNVKSETKKKSNWVFTLNLANLDIKKNSKSGTYDTLDMTRKLFERFSATYSGLVMFEAIHGEDILFSCTLSGKFISLLLTKMVVASYNKQKDKKGFKEEKKVINLGSSYCSRHNTYHRISRYVQYDTLVKEENEKDEDSLLTIFTESEWADILSRCVHCKP